MSSSGRVYLIGAGPGDAALFTLRGKELLGRADVVIYDGLVNRELLRFAPPTAEIIYGGKHDRTRCVSQDDLNALLLRKARAGGCVVRLKGGDPFIFGRGGEEVEHLREAGIAVQVINGITSGLAGLTSLGVPLTHRDHAHGVVFITGHAKPGITHESRGTDWQQLAATARDAKLTLVIYMGVSSAAQIQTDLLTGLPADTPLAIVQHASLPQQRHAVGTLGALTDTLAREGLGSPSVIVVGDVVRGIAAVAQPAGAQARRAA